MSDMTQEHPAFDLIRKYVDEGMYDPTAQQGAPEQPAPDVPPQGQQALDFAGQQGDMGEQQAQEAPQQQAPQQPPQAAPAPTPQQHPQLNALNAPQIAGNYHQDMNQSQDQYNQGVQQEAQGIQQQTAANMANNDAAAQALPQFAEVDRQYQAARDGIDAHVLNVSQQAVADMHQDLARQEQLLNENPHDWWGNASTVNKISAIVGMIGAGLHGDNASEYFGKIVENGVAESRRKEGILNHIERSRDRLLNAENKIADNQLASVEARKAAGYAYIKNQLAQRVAMSKNPQEIANYNKEIGKLNQKVAEHTEKGSNDIIGHDLNALRTQLEVERFKADQQQQAVTNAQGKPQEDPNKYLALGAFKGRGVQSVVYKEASEKISSSESVVAGIEQARKLLSHPSVNSAYGLKQVNAQILSELRKLQGTGANLSPEEVKNIEALTPAWGDVVRGSLSLVDFNARLTAAQRLVSNSALRYAKNVGAPENQLDESSPLYGVRKGEDDEEQAGEKELSDKERADNILKKYARQ